MELGIRQRAPAEGPRKIRLTRRRHNILPGVLTDWSAQDNSTQAHVLRLLLSSTKINKGIFRTFAVLDRFGHIATYAIYVGTHVDKLIQSEPWLSVSPLHLQVSA